MIIDCISDLHGHYPRLEGGDLLIVAGDLTARDDFASWLEFTAWFQLAKYKKKILIGGNHDNWFVNNPPHENTFGDDSSYLCDYGTEFEGLKIWGSPWTAYFEGMNPNCMAFTLNYGCDTDQWLAEKWDLIPDDTNILVTHSPPLGISDINCYGEKCGSNSLAKKARTLHNLKLFIFGHIHESYSVISPESLMKTMNEFPNRKVVAKSIPYLINASHVNERYEPVNKPIRIEL
jgi:predicted phosphohydrolase